MDKDCCGVETGRQASNLRLPDFRPAALSLLSYILVLFHWSERTHNWRPIEIGQEAGICTRTVSFTGRDAVITPRS